MPKADDAPTMPASSTATPPAPPLAPVMPPDQGAASWPALLPPLAEASGVGLVALCHEFLVLDREVARRMIGLASVEEGLRAEAECEPLNLRMDALVEQIAATPATTEEERRGKAAVAWQLADQQQDGAPIAHGQHDVVTHSLVADLLGTAATPGTGGDAALLATCAEIAEIDRASDALLDAVPVGGWDERSQARWDAYNAATMPRWHELFATMADTPARDAPGLHAKADILFRLFEASRTDAQGRAIGDEPLDQGMWSLLKDLVHGPALVRAPAPFNVTPHPDAELIRLGWQLEAAWIAQDARYAADPPPDDDENEATIAPCSEIAGAIERMPATTLAGLRTKARAYAWCIFTERKEVGQFEPERFGWTTDERLIRSMLQALVNMGLPAPVAPVAPAEAA